MRAFTFWKIPLISWLGPSVMELGEKRTVIRIPLKRRSKNHLGSMYFGALAVGAELVVAAKALNAIQASGKKVDFVFKDFKSDFLKRAEGNVFFVCDEGEKVEALVALTLQTGERTTGTFSGYAYVPSKDMQEKVMTFAVTLSVRYRQA